MIRGGRKRPVQMANLLLNDHGLLVKHLSINNGLKWALYKYGLLLLFSAAKVFLVRIQRR